MRSISPARRVVVQSPRQAVVDRVHGVRSTGRALLVVSAGAGIIASSAARAGADLLVVYSSSRYRMAGLGSLAALLPIGDANAIVLDLASEIAPLAGTTPVLVGVCASDPFRPVPALLAEIRAAGYSGVQNFPTVGLYGSALQASLDDIGMGFDREIDLVTAARAADLYTAPFVFSPDQAVAMVNAGADAIVPHLGLTTGGAIGANRVLSTVEAAERVATIADAARHIRADVTVLFHGGPASGPAAVQAILDRAPQVDGFVSASATERLPVEAAVEGAVSAMLTLRTSSPDRTRPKPSGAIDPLGHP